MPMHTSSAFSHSAILFAYDFLSVPFQAPYGSLYTHVASAADADSR
jgi:hypothetical protein